jgi:hypothetical protein
MTSTDRSVAARARRWGWGGLLLLWTLVVVRSLTAPGEVPPNRLDAATRAALGRQAHEKEPEWRLETQRRFPGERWSQDEDFHATENAWVRAQAARHRAPIADVLRAVDEDLKAHPPAPPRKATAAPCKPRPFYD